jgi:hypothetical protein
MLANSSIDICICITWLFAVVLPQSIVGFIEKAVNSISLERKGADDRDRKVVPVFGAHLSSG